MVSFRVKVLVVYIVFFTNGIVRSQNERRPFSLGTFSAIDKATQIGNFTNSTDRIVINLRAQTVVSSLSGN